MIIVYRKPSGRILSTLSPEPLDLNFYLNSFEGEIGYLIGDIPNPLDYIVKNNTIIKLSDQESYEMRNYGDILTEDERRLHKLIPSEEEVKKAERTIEIVELILEVLR